jgi:hypothetical protein
MKRRALILAALVAVLLAIPMAAVAKGGIPTAATIHGKDLAAMFSRRAGPPGSGDLAARYTVTYLIPPRCWWHHQGPPGPAPYAAGGPVTYTPARELGADGRRVQAGWWQATPSYPRCLRR